MDRYNFRTSSLNNDQLNTELAKRGAKTFGSLQRKQQRLQRFIDAEQERETLRVVVEQERRKVYRQVLTAVTGRQGRTRISELLDEYLGY